MPRPHRQTKHRARVLIMLTMLGASSVASAQLRLPSLNVPAGFDSLNSALRERADSLVKPEPLLSTLNLRALRMRAVGDLLRLHSDVVEADPLGQPMVRHEVLAWSPSPAVQERARAAGLIVVRERVLSELDATVVTFRAAAGTSTASALALLRELDADGWYDFNHLYTSSGATGPDVRAASSNTAAAPEPEAPAAGTRLGLVDGGVDGGHAVFRGATIAHWGCAGKSMPSPHGTAVASLMIGKADRFAGVAPKASLYAADIYCGSPTGGAADTIVEALAWMAKARIGVVNLSLVGPPNRTLERVVRAMTVRGHVLVAAVGNDGPAAAPLYPASYPGVVGVSAVDARRRALPEAARGPQVMFAAPGSNMAAANTGPVPYQTVRGTSFAAPIVATLLALQLAGPDPAAAKGAIADLARHAAGSAAIALTPELGYGVVGAAFRVDPARLR